MKRHPLLAGGGVLFPCYIAADKNLHLLHGSSLSVSAERYFFQIWHLFLMWYDNWTGYGCAYPAKASFQTGCFLFVVFCVAGFVSFFVLLYFPATASSPSGGGAFFIWRNVRKSDDFAECFINEFRKVAFQEYFLQIHRRNIASDKFNYAT